NAQAEFTNSNVLVNCASQEYFGAVVKKALIPSVVTPVFMEDKDSSPKIISFFAKKARGAMARYMVQNQISDLDGLKAFDSGGYVFKPKLSNDSKIVFVRPYPMI
ncbi:MAG: peroxide stress protein YaaA, partial [Phycisphaerae bacterium]|nr:peroxide stress protein YaaA [Phycisphaerae bacterium]